MEGPGLSSAEQRLVRESWQQVSARPLEHGTVLFASLKGAARSLYILILQTNTSISLNSTTVASNSDSHDIDSEEQFFCSTLLRFSMLSPSVDGKIQDVQLWGLHKIVVVNCPCVGPVGETSPRLFDLDPDLLPLFQYNCKKFSTPEECLSSPEFLEHIRKVMSVIDAAVSHLENLHSLAEYLANLGKKHQAVGVKLESFSTVGESLLYMLEKCHGPAFNMNVREAWTKLYSTVVKSMSCGWDIPGKVE